MILRWVRALWPRVEQYKLFISRPHTLSYLHHGRVRHLRVEQARRLGPGELVRSQRMSVNHIVM